MKDFFVIDAEAIKEAIMSILEKIADFVKAILGKELEGEDFAGIL